ATHGIPARTELAWSGGEIRTSADVPPGHKIALRDVQGGQPVHKYGQIIGYATSSISPGDWVHTHNLHNGQEILEYEYSTDLRQPKPLLPGEDRIFMGIKRPDGRTGTRNYLSIVSTVNCSADTVHLIAERLRREALPDYPNVDGIVAATHKMGCGM